MQFSLRLTYLALGVLALWVTASAFTASPEWGFFGHRRINRLAVFTVDADMMPFFRHHLEYLTDHAVDPDKRRYASPHEAVRHYMDLDHWGVDRTFPEVPRKWVDALLWRGEFRQVRQSDTLRWRVDSLTEARVYLSSNRRDTSSCDLWDARSTAYRHVLPQYYEERIIVPPDSLAVLGIDWSNGEAIEFHEGLSEYGILPYHLAAMHRRLTQAFVDEDTDRILRLAAEMGHYLGDAHVPLHTTENYNGQLTGQTGIHAFWESRLPELFADVEYDYFVGPAEYIDDPETYYWRVVLDSHALVDSVLQTEARLRTTFPADRQFAFEERLGKTGRQPSTEFSKAWQTAMHGMVEARFRAAILAVGSAWYSCWVDAGQPDLDRLVQSQTHLAITDSVSVATKPARSHEFR